MNLYDWFLKIGQNPNLTVIPISPTDINNVKNGIIKLSGTVEKEQPFFSNELFALKDRLFIGYGTINPGVFGQIYMILKTLKHAIETPTANEWDYLHPKVSAIAKERYLNGYFADAVEAAFKEIEVNVRKALYTIDAEKSISSTVTLMTTVFSDNTPILELCDRSTVTGKDIQKGYMYLFAGAMSGIRNPKAHENTTISKEEAMQKLMFASLLMHKLEQAIEHTKTHKVDNQEVTM